MNDEVPVSLIIEDGQSEEFGIEELCRHSRRVLWLSVRDGRRVVYKGLTEDLRDHPEEIASLRKEYSLGLRMDCEGVVRYYSFEMHPQLGPVIVMEYVDGYTLPDYLGKSRNDGVDLPPLDERLQISMDIAGSIEMMHGAGVLHRDLKPDNILIRKRDLRPKIIDFGHADSEDFMIYKNSVGTLQYGSPEQQIPSGGSVSGDIYSFGKILEKLLPEQRYRSIVDACISEDESGRPDIKWIRARLSNSGRGRSRWIWIIGVVIGMLSIGAVLGFYFSNDNGNAAVDGGSDEVKADSLFEIRAMGDESEVAEKQSDGGIDKIISKSGEEFKAREEDVKVQYHSKPTDTVDDKSDQTIQDKITIIVNKYTREADNINKHYGKLSFTDNVEENGQLRMKRSKDHQALLVSMEKELSGLGIDKSMQMDAYNRVWGYITAETIRIDGVDEKREEILRKLESIH